MKRRVYVVGDSAYVNRTTIEDRPANVEVLGPLHPDAALFEFGASFRVIKEIVSRVKPALSVCFELIDVAIFEHAFGKRFPVPRSRRSAHFTSSQQSKRAQTMLLRQSNCWAW